MIGKLKGGQVIAIDSSRRELEDAAGGRFLIWDAVIPPRDEEEKDVAVFQLTVRLPEEKIETGYGILWPEERRRTAHYVELAEKAGFEVVMQQEEGQRFFLELRKQ